MDYVHRLMRRTPYFTHDCNECIYLGSSAAVPYIAKRRLEHALISDDQIRRLRSERQQIHDKISQMLNQLKDF